MDRSAGQPWLDYTKQIGGHIAAIEFMNEPTLLSFGGVPKGYDAASFGSDAKIFGAFLHQESPGTIYLGRAARPRGFHFRNGPVDPWRGIEARHNQFPPLTITFVEMPSAGI